LISKIEFALPIYGNAPKSTLRPIKTYINSALRSALGAFPSTPTHNLYLEANVCPLETKLLFMKAKLWNTIVHSQDTPLYPIVNKIINKQNKKYKNSVLQECIDICTNLGLTITPVKKLPKSNPPWHIKPESLDTHLNKKRKASTPKEIFLKEFLETKHKLKNYTLIYTDGSLSKEIIGYAITTESSTIKLGVLPEYSSVYAAEATAILDAIEISLKTRGKTCICTDSLSVVEGIKNIENSTYLISKIRSLIINNFPKIKLLWVPSHMGIAGNEFADEAAKAATISPLIASANINKFDRNRYLKSTLLNYVPQLINKTSTWYQTTNVSHLNIAHYTKNPVFSKLSRNEQTKLIRLRLGHIRLTHANRFVQPPSNQCKFCNSTDTSIIHILNECPSFHNIRPKTPNSDLIPFLTNPKPENIIILLKFLKKANIMNEL